MKTNYFLTPLCAALTLAFSVHALAAERQTKFAVTELQMVAMNIQTESLRRDAAPVVISLPAQVTVPANREQIVSAPMAGLAVELYVQPNQVVKQGAALLRLVVPELGPLQLQLMQASTRTGLARQAALREQALFKEGIIAQRRVQESQAALAEAEAALRQAKAALRLAGMPAGTIDRVAAAGQLQDGLTLHAPKAGIVTNIEVKPGQRVEPASALMRLAQTDRLALEIQAPAANVTAWRVGSKLKLQDRAGAATVVSVSPTVVAGSQTVAIRAEMDAAVAGLRAGEFVTVQLPMTADAASWDLPLAALAHDGTQAYVFVRVANRFEARPVKVVGSAGQRVRVQGALKDGERVAVSGVVALKGSWLGEKGGA
jgi:cobalt-zinc-cadmium efflux system membrane fusion protein